MILYATKQTRERYKLKLPHELTPPLNEYAQKMIGKESGDELLEWGCKLFYFDRRKCIQVVNLASKFTLFLCDVKIDKVNNIGNMIAGYLLELYKDDTLMYNCIEKMFEESPIFCFDKLTNKSLISTLNRTQLDFAFDGYRFYGYIDNGILRTLQINHDVNYEWLFTKTENGKTEYFYSGEKFRELVVSRYGDDNYTIDSEILESSFEESTLENEMFEEEKDDAFCEALITEYENDTDKGNFITIEELYGLLDDSDKIIN